MTFKKLGSDIQRQRALSPFLEASECITGLLLSVAIDKASLFIGSDADIRKTLPDATGTWSCHHLRKTLTIGILVNFLIAAFAREGQNVVWITDQDAIVPNVNKGRQNIEFLARLTQHFGAPNLGTLTVTTSAIEDSTRAVEDGLALPDLAAGAVAELFNTFPQEFRGTTPALIIPMPKGISVKTQQVLRWLFRQNGSLSKVVLRIGRGSGDSFGLDTVVPVEGLIG